MSDYKMLGAFIYWISVVVYLILEIQFSYRAPSVSKWKRWLGNLPLPVINGAIYYFVFAQLLEKLMLAGPVNKTGLLNQFEFSYWVKFIVSILLLDLMIYTWHLLNHEVPFLWKFHAVHHSDINMDVSTASRFHLFEILLSGFVRMATVYSLGIPLEAYLWFEIIANISVQFHHSSINTPEGFDRIWGLFFVPPSFHRTHHSVKKREYNSNYGVILSIWDRFLGTLNDYADQKRLVIGLRDHQDFKYHSLPGLLWQPFRKKRRISR